MTQLSLNRSNPLRLTGRQSVPIAGALALIGLAAAGLAAAPDTRVEPAPAPDIAAKPPTNSPKRVPEAEVLVEPQGATVEIFARVGEGTELKSLLLRSGATQADAANAAKLISQATPAGIPDGVEIGVLLGEAVKGDSRRLERLTIQPSEALKLIVGRGRDGSLRLVREAIAVNATPLRIAGRVGTGLFWSLRSAGVSAEAAREYLDALSSRIDLRDVRPDDRFELVVDHWRTPSGRSRTGSLLYAGLHRPGGKTLHLVRWTGGGTIAWFEPGNPRQRVEGFEQPVNGAISSRFGHRVHPILRIGRLHDGVDFRAGWGTPVVAAADGAVVGAGWNGGYGRQVRLAHSNGLATSYSHLSRIAAAPGTSVRRGEVIGYVGSSGFSTGPHLHYEVRRNGRPVDPLSFRHSTVATISAFDLAAIRARLNQLRST